MCLPGTRVDLLREIHAWAKAWVNDSAAPAIFWLNGMGGAGKSTLSRTIAHDLHRSKRLGASFFFKRGEAGRGNVSKFFPTLAWQLMTAQPSLSSHIKSAVDSDPGIFATRLQTQFETLITEPPSHLDKATAITLVVDASTNASRTTISRSSSTFSPPSTPHRPLHVGSLLLVDPSYPCALDSTQSVAPIRA